MILVQKKIHKDKLRYIKFDGRKFRLLFNEKTLLIFTISLILSNLLLLQILPTVDKIISPSGVLHTAWLFSASFTIIVSYIYIVTNENILKYLLDYNSIGSKEKVVLNNLNRNVRKELDTYEKQLIEDLIER